MIVDNELELLTAAVSWRLLSGQRLGRVSITVGALPVILPVRFLVFDNTIVVRTSPGSKLEAAAAGAIVAFEADRIELDGCSGWSVLVVGRSEIVCPLDGRIPALADELGRFADGTHPSFVRIHPELVTGRRLVARQQQQGQGPDASIDVGALAHSRDQPFSEVCRALTEASAHMVRLDESAPPVPSTLGYL